MDALVLSGGGARGAYEVGVLRYLREELPADVRAQIHFDLITGTSVGALNGCFLAGTADEPDTQAYQLAQLWGGLDMEDMFNLQLGTAFQAVLGAYRSIRKKGEGRGVEGILGGMLNTRAIYDMVNDAMDWSRISRNIAAGHVSGVSVSALEIVSGNTVTFVQREGGYGYPRSEDPRRHVQPTELRPEHALASAAIPLIFPPVKVSQSYYSDGGLRQNTPLSPALRMGATRVFVVSLKHTRTQAEDDAATAQAIGAVPDPMMLMGKVMDALLLDRLDYDLSVLQRINRILELGEKTYGDDFRWVVGEAVAATRGIAYKRVEAFHVYPSRDLGQVASDFLRSLNPERKKRVFATSVGRWLLPKDANSETDLMSFLLFDGQFASTLIELGMEDAHAMREDLIRYFQGGPGNL